MRDIIAEGLEDDTTLFVKERQNLYIDQVSETAIWSAILKRLKAVAVTSDIAESLTSWAIDGLKSITEAAKRHRDGPLGWSSKPDVFNAGLQVICAVDVLLHWRLQIKNVPISGADMRKNLQEFLEAGQAADLHEMWLSKAQSVLQQAVVKRLASLNRSVASVIPNMDCSI